MYVGVVILIGSSSHEYMVTVVSIVGQCVFTLTLLCVFTLTLLRYYELVVLRTQAPREMGKTRIRHISTTTHCILTKF